MPRVDADYSIHAAALSHGTQKPVRIILHDTESGTSGPQAALNIVDFWLGGSLDGAHLIIDSMGKTYRVGSDFTHMWHTGGNNDGSLGIEQIGFETFSRARWFMRPLQLMKVARWIAFWSHAYGIPIEPSISRGVSTHAMNSAVFPASQGHTDPGPGYPFGFVLVLARTYLKFSKF